MPPLVLIDDDERLEYSVGAPPQPTEDNPQPEDDRTVFLYHRVPYSERQALFDLYATRGRMDQVALDMAIIATGLLGWKNLMSSSTGDILFPPSDGLSVLEHRQQVLAIIERVLVNDGYELAKAMQDPSPEALLRQWHPSRLNGVPTQAPATPVPVMRAVSE